MRALTWPEQTEERQDDNNSRVIVAREGSELAERLRAGGWAVRAGWRTTDETGMSVWYVRFESPGETNVESISRVAT